MYIVPAWLYKILVFSTLSLVLFILAAVVGACIGPIYRRLEERKEREAELDADCLPADIEAMEENYPGPIDGESLIRIEGVCASCLDGMMENATSVLGSLYDRLNSRIGTEEREYIQRRIFEMRALLSFLAFAQTHAIDAFLTYVQNGNVFFEEEEGGEKNDF